MLCHWAKDYEKKDARCLEYYSLDSVADVERAIGKWNASHTARQLYWVLFCGCPVCADGAVTRRYMYVEQQDLEEFVKDLELEPVSVGGNVV